jgi:hypothetical protein
MRIKINAINQGLYSNPHGKYVDCSSLALKRLSDRARSLDMEFNFDSYLIALRWAKEEVKFLHSTPKMLTRFRVFSGGVETTFGAHASSKFTFSTMEAKTIFILDTNNRDYENSSNQ